MRDYGSRRHRTRISLAACVYGGHGGRGGRLSHGQHRRRQHGLAPPLPAARPLPPVHGPGDGASRAIRLPGAATQVPASTADCERLDGIACFDPDQLRAAYQLPPLYAKGITGTGVTIMIVDSFGSPTIRADLAAFDRQFGYPAPPNFTIIAPVGKIPRVQSGQHGHGGLGGGDHA